MVDWLLKCDEPWTRYRTRLDLLHQDEREPDVMSAREEMLAHPLIIALIQQASTWPGYGLKRHNDAKHPIYALSTLADFGLRDDDPGITRIVRTVMSYQSAEGPFQTKLQLYERFHGSDDELMTWVACDAPTVVYALVRFGLHDDPAVREALDHLENLAEDSGWRCRAAQQLGSEFKGPGRREDPCPIANVYALKVLAQVPGYSDSAAVRNGIEMLLAHWMSRGQRKMYLFGIGTDFRKLKYPFVWYDILHVAEVLSQFKIARDDTRFQEMQSTIVSQADAEGRYTATSMYRHWKDWSFANKNSPSPWLTFLVHRIMRRASCQSDSDSGVLRHG